METEMEIALVIAATIIMLQGSLITAHKEMLVAVADTSLTPEALMSKQARFAKAVADGEELLLRLTEQLEVLVG